MKNTLATFAGILLLGSAPGAKGGETGDDAVIRECTETLKTSTSNATVYGNRGAAYKRKGMITEALADYSMAIELDAKHLERKNDMYFYWRAECRRLKGDYKKAIPDYNEAIQINARNGYFWFGRAEIYRDLEKHDLAVADYTEAIKLIDNNPFFYYYRGLSYHSLVMLKEAVDDFQKALDIGGFSEPESLRAKIEELKLDLK
jgi:tetratricopeptide (TPR) repeat protein